MHTKHINTFEYMPIHINICKYRRIITNTYQIRTNTCTYQVSLHTNICNTYCFAWYNRLQMTGPCCLVVVSICPHRTKGEGLFKFCSVHLRNIFPYFWYVTPTVTCITCMPIVHIFFNKGSGRIITSCAKFVDCIDSTKLIFIISLKFGPWL